MQTMPTSDNSHHKSSQDASRDREVLTAARERGWITLDEIMRLASGSPVDLDEAMHVTREAGIDLVDSDDADDSDDNHDPWADVEALAEDGADAFTARRTAPDVTD